MLRRIILAAMSLLVVVACQERESSRQADSVAALANNSTPAAASAADAVEGNWHIVAHHEPGIAAMSPKEADTWIGRRARYSRSLARLGTNQCSAPSYETTSLTTQAFAEEYRVQSADLELRAPIQVVEVRCAGPSNGPGNRLFVKSPNELLALWDGVFFELHRE